jgi:hypothetical protein
MSVDQPGVIDLVAVDPTASEVLLVMVEDRPWGRRGELLPALQAKFSAYLTYALEGQLARDYPQVAGKPVRFELRSLESPGPREAEFLRILEAHHLAPEGIRFAWRAIKEPAQ